MDEGFDGFEREHMQEFEPHAEWKVKA